MARAYLQHLKSSKDLETSYEAIRAGFVALALGKNRRATPFVAEARALKAAATRAETPLDLLNIAEIQPALLTAAGVSEKATAHLQEADKQKAVGGLISKFLEPAGASFVEELVFRFLLTRGDALGGSMRNIGGFIAQTKLTRAIIACLKVAGRRCLWQHAETHSWAALPQDDAGIELHLRGLSWRKANEPRTLVYNRKVSILGKTGKNVDLCLLRCEPADAAIALNAPKSYLALGELKGGIDPAGADEHWKTAYAALSRIHRAFSARKLKPHTFFIGGRLRPRWRMKSGKCCELGNLKAQRISLTTTKLRRSPSGFAGFDRRHFSAVPVGKLTRSFMNSTA